MFVLLRTKHMQLRDHADTQPVNFPIVERAIPMRYICHIKVRMLLVRENEIALGKLSGGTAHAHLRTLEGTMLLCFSKILSPNSYLVESETSKLKSSEKKTQT